MATDERLKSKPKDVWPITLSNDLEDVKGKVNLLFTASRLKIKEILIKDIMITNGHRRTYYKNEESLELDGYPVIIKLQQLFIISEQFLNKKNK